MKLSELRPCDGCGRPLTSLPGGGSGLSFLRVRITPVVLHPQSLHQTLGVLQSLGGRGLGLAEALSPAPEVAIPLSARDPKLETQLLLCLACYSAPARPWSLDRLVSQRAEAARSAAPPPSARASRPEEGP